MDVDVFEGHLARKGSGQHRHPGHPEKDDVEARHQHAGGIPTGQVGGLLVRPAQGREGPQAAGKPGVEGVGILLEQQGMGVGASAVDGFGLRHGF